MNKHKLCALAVCPLIALTGSTAFAAAVSGQGTWESTLQGRDLDGNLSTFEAYYDTTLDITWLADANYSATSMIFDTAITWATGLNLGGVDGWRLPTTPDSGNDGPTYTSIFQGVDYGFNITNYSEMSHMFYETLGNTAPRDPSGALTECGSSSDNCLTNTGPFSNIYPHTYWSGTEYIIDSGSAWDFNFSNGFQMQDSKLNSKYAWAVHDGDVGTSVVPVPAAAWLFGWGLLGLIGVARKQH